MASMSTKCTVCRDYFTRTAGERKKLPRLLPCTHTVCEDCFLQIREEKQTRRQNRLQIGYFVACPECRAYHELPQGMVPENRYVLELLERNNQLEEKNKELDEKNAKIEKLERENAAMKAELYFLKEPVLCGEHGRQCVMFCLQKECWCLLCPKCPLETHTEHNRVSLTESIADSDELKEMRKEAIGEITLLEEFETNITNSKEGLSLKTNETLKAMHNKLIHLQRVLAKNAAELRDDIQRKSKIETEKLDKTFAQVDAELTLGKEIKHNVDNRKQKTLGDTIQHLIKIRSQVTDFKSSAQEARSKEIIHELVDFQEVDDEAVLNHPIGKIFSATVVCHHPKGEPLTPALAAAGEKPQPEEVETFNDTEATADDEEKDDENLDDSTESTPEKDKTTDTELEYQTADDMASSPKNRM